MSPFVTAPEDPPEVPPRYQESLAATLRRTLAIAFVLTTALTLVSVFSSGLSDQPWWRFWIGTFPAVLWFPLGGHYVELVYLNLLRHRSPTVRQHRRPVRILTWLIGGLPLGIGCWLTWEATGSAPPLDPPMWWGMPFFVVVECVVHAILTLAGQPSFWNGRE